jgi:hypothetical protein
MFHNLEMVIAIVGVIWGAVQLIKHFVPDWYTKQESTYWTQLEQRVTEVEKKLGGK